ncbi:MAG: hypothetical protein EOP07_15545 [Proteobacteria bacterium]|nr:MAG: hypothetical protein EOP07_15545 [Pseudomonadota bacterium]
MQTSKSRIALILANPDGTAVNPGTGTGTNPGTGTPTTPGTGTNPGTVTPTNPGTGTPINPGTGAEVCKDKSGKAIACPVTPEDPSQNPGQS